MAAKRTTARPSRRTSRVSSSAPSRAVRKAPAARAKPAQRRAGDADTTEATAMARTILAGFDRHYRLFRDVSVQARDRFERGAWAEVVAAHRERIHMYDERVRETVRTLTRRHAEACAGEALWPEVKGTFMALLYGHLRPECAETFFNSVASHVLQRRYFNNRHVFFRPAISTEHLYGKEPTYRCYLPRASSLREVFQQVLLSCGLKGRFEDVALDATRMEEAFHAEHGVPGTLEDNCQVQVLHSLFFRNRAAYLVGRFINGSNEHPFVVPILRTPEGAFYVDALLLKPGHIAQVFSLGRAYFMVDMEVPAAYVDFLQSIMPRKPRAELYTLLGLQKQGKTLFYRDMLDHLRHSQDTFEIAPGTRGMVMVVFTLPSFPYVFKVIRDWYDPPKDTSRDLVKERYLYVKTHDRVGRLADTLEYSDVAFPRDRFSLALVEEFRRKAPSQFHVVGDRVVIKHLYIERRMVPLDLGLQTADPATRHDLVRALGDCLRELAGANIFPGDILLKNFGVNRYGRVVCYDYDELVPLVETSFRPLPGEDDEGNPTSYGVGPHDVFPEEFARFMFSDVEARAIFQKEHADLCEPRFWVQQQQRIRAGEMEQFFPYPQSMRFPRAPAVTPT
jgi:isocitrate dehydrogenase kinase/phosphatase